MSRIGYVVVEYNQASGEPRVSGDVHWRVEGARAELEYEQEATARAGRRETYEIGVIVPLDEED